MQEGTFYSSLEKRCKAVTEVCPPGQYKSRLARPDADTQCSVCPSCQPGFYRDPSDCKSDR